MPAHLEYVPQHACRRRLAVRSRDCGDRDAAGLVGRKQHVENGTGDIARRSLAWCDVHAKPRPRVDLANAAAGFAVRLRNVSCQEIDAADVETDRLYCAFRHFAVVRVDDVRYIDGRAAGRQVSRRSQINDLVFVRHGRVVVSQFLEQAFGLVIEFQAGQDFLVSDPAAGVLVNDIDELFYGMLAVTQDMARHSLGRGNEFAVDDQEPVVVALEISFDDDASAVFSRLLECDFDFVRRLQIDRYAAAMITGKRFEHDGKTDSLRRAHCILCSPHKPLIRHRQAEVPQDAIGFLLVGRELHRDIAGAARRRRLDALLVPAVTELHQALAVQANPRDTAFLGGLNERCRAWSERTCLGVTNKVVAHLGKFPVTRRGIRRPYVLR